MKQNKIEFVQTRIDYKTIGFSYGKKRSVHKSRFVRWIDSVSQNVLFWIADRMGLRHEEKVLYCERIVVDMNKLSEYIFKQNNEIASLCHQRGGVILIGPGEFIKLEGHLRDSIHLALDYKVSDCSGLTSCYGMRVIIIPWMDGLLVVPKETLIELGS